MPNQIKALLEKGKNLDNEWNNDDKLVEKINDCINIENNIKNIKEIYDNIEKCNSKKIDIEFIPEDEQITELTDKIKNFGEIYYEENDEFKPGNNYNITNNGLTATKNGRNGWNCVILGEREIPKDRISKWKIKIVKNKTIVNNQDIYIGIGPNKFQDSLYNECWNIYSRGGDSKIQLYLKNKSSGYNNQNINLKKDDIIEVIVDRKLGNLSFAVNGFNCGIACSTIPKEDILFPTIVLYEQGISVEIV